ncbi:MAG TPA: glycosyltransferase family 2 protein [Spirochaetota bacterium]|nr:glycosyltransferase family 2 protein [Spirochaetota bacterium]HNT11678.1 glycosyltransferase family 2 protein [Spirochaetota bacterium]
MKLSIVIPCYNEERNIPLILERFAAVITRDDVEVILVDNGSTDGSAGVLSKLLPGHAFARSVRVPVNQGYGYGILEGLREATGMFIGWTHADMQTDPRDTIIALEIIEVRGGGADLFLKGNRKGRSLFDVFFTVGMSVFESTYLGRALWDINAQPNIFHREFFAGWSDPPHDFSLDLYALYQARSSSMTVVRFPVRFPKRIHGVSSWNTGLAAKWKFIKRTIEFSTRLKGSMSRRRSG